MIWIRQKLHHQANYQCEIVESRPKIIIVWYRKIRRWNDCLQIVTLGTLEPVYFRNRFHWNCLNHFPLSVLKWLQMCSKNLKTMLFLDRSVFNLPAIYGHKLWSRFCVVNLRHEHTFWSFSIGKWLTRTLVYRCEVYRW